MEKNPNTQFVIYNDQEVQPEFPPGYNFEPTQPELIDYLKKKLEAPASSKNSQDHSDYLMMKTKIPYIDVYGNLSTPDRLPEKYHQSASGESLWYCFTCPTRKNNNGERPSRTTKAGFWKASSGLTEILSEDKELVIGHRRNLVFYENITEQPQLNQGVQERKKTSTTSSSKTDWLMQEFSCELTPTKKRTSSGHMKLDKMVLCKIYKREGSAKKNAEVAAVEGSGTSYANPETPFVGGNYSEMNNNVEYGYNNMVNTIEEEPMNQQLPNSFGHVNTIGEEPFWMNQQLPNSFGTVNTIGEEPFSMNQQLPNSFGHVNTIGEEPLWMNQQLPNSLSDLFANGDPALDFATYGAPNSMDNQNMMYMCDNSLNHSNISVPSDPQPMLGYLQQYSNQFEPHQSAPTRFENP